jgi:ankyrin repeat protein
MIKKDKEKVFGGEWSEAQLEEFLVEQDYPGETANFTSIIRAYRHMMPASFADFLVLLKEKGGDLNAKNEAGETAYSIIANHPKGAEFATLLEEAGAK